MSQQLTDGKVPELKVFESNGLGRNQVAPIGGPWLEWDDNGNLTRKGDFHYKWDFRNRLVRVTRDGVGEIARYEYDAFDRRVVRTVESVEHQTSWAGWQALETRKAGALVDRRVYGVGLDEVVAIGLDVTGDGAIDGAYVPLYDSSGNVAVLTGSDGRVVERYDYRAFGPRETRVDSVRPQITSERIASSSFEVRWDEEISIEVLSERIDAEEIEITLDDAPLVIDWSDPEGVPTADGGLADTKSAAKSTADVVVSLPVEAGRRTLRFAFATAPAPGAEIVVTLPVGAIEDYYNNATTETTTFSFTWPAGDTILNDTRAPRLDRASVIEGCVELVFDEEIDPATWSAATIDQGAVDWASCENGFGLCQQTCLATGAAHALELGATLADLAGNTLDGGGVGHGFDLSTTDTQHIWRRPDPRLLTSATGAVVDKSVSSAVRQALGFHGLPIDPETGLVYVRHRYYDPEMGRFLSQDPLGYVDGGNLYQYGLNNPGDLSDPLGLQTLPAAQPPAMPVAANDNFRLGLRLLQGGGQASVVGVGPVALCAANPVMCASSLGVGILGGRLLGSRLQPVPGVTLDELLSEAMLPYLVSAGEMAAAEDLPISPWALQPGQAVGEEVTPLFDHTGAVVAWLPISVSAPGRADQQASASNSPAAALPSLPDGYHYRSVGERISVVRNRGRAADLAALHLEGDRLVMGPRPSLARSSATRSAFLRQLDSSRFPRWMSRYLAEGRVPPGFAVHHRKALFDGGTDSVDNMVLMPVDLHRIKHHYYRPGGRIPSIDPPHADSD